MELTDHVSIHHETKGKHPRLPFVLLKNALLGTRYELSIAFVSSKTSQKLNRMYRSKNKPTNVLSFPIDAHSGELVLDLKKIKAEYKDFGMRETQFIVYLLIHGMLHLKGMEHSSTMEKQEKKFLKKFGISLPNNLVE